MRTRSTRLISPIKKMRTRSTRLISPIKKMRTRSTRSISPIKKMRTRSTRLISPKPIFKKPVSIKPGRKIVDAAKEATIAKLTPQTDIKTGTLTIPKYSLSDIYGSSPDNAQRTFYDSIKNNSVSLKAIYDLNQKMKGLDINLLPPEQKEEIAKVGNLGTKLIPNLLTPITIGKTDWVKNGAQQKLTKALKVGDVQSTQEAINTIKEQDNQARENLLIDLVNGSNDPAIVATAQKQLDEKTFVDKPMTPSETEKVIEEFFAPEKEEVKEEIKEQIKLSYLDQLVEYIYQTIYN